jgi:UDP-glucose 4-epimerase
MSEPSHSVSGRRVMVTGGCGFIGSHLARRLVEQGAREVLVLDKMKYGAARDLPAGVKVVRFALGEDEPGLLQQHLAGIDHVFHLAAEKHSQTDRDPDVILSSNVGGTQALLTAASRAGVRKVVFASSVYAYGRMGLPAMVETELPQPRTVYGVSKLAGEHLTAAAAARGGFEWIVLRYFFVYGPGQFRGSGYKSVIVKNGERLLQGLPPTVMGDGEQALDYVYVDDVVDATLRALESSVSGETFNVASGQAVTVNRLLAGLAATALASQGQAGAPLDKVHLPPDDTAGSCRVGSIDRIQAVLGWCPRVNLEEGLYRTYGWMREAFR